MRRANHNLRVRVHARPLVDIRILHVSVATQFADNHNGTNQRNDCGALGTHVQRLAVRFVRCESHLHLVRRAEQRGHERLFDAGQRLFARLSQCRLVVSENYVHSRVVDDYCYHVHRHRTAVNNNWFFLNQQR